jgi:hypothetical protein
MDGERKAWFSQRKMTNAENAFLTRFLRYNAMSALTYSLLIKATEKAAFFIPITP